jgi:membrane fusion protein (multidrug efflux system)
LKYTAELKAQTEQRQKQLLEKEAISREEYDIAFTNLKTTQAEIDGLQAAIDKSRIRAPFSGYIGLRYVSEGSYITPSSQIASLYNVNPIKIEFSVPSRYSGLVKKGSEITFRSEAEKKERNAVIYAIEPQIDPVTRTLTARAETQNANNELIPGQFIRINLSLENRENAILIPTTAIMPKADGHTIFIIKDGTAHLKDVELGARTANRVEILKGISAGDTVAIAGVPQLKDRAEVDIKKLEK